MHRSVIRMACGVLLLAAGCGGGSSGPPANPSAPPPTVSAPPETVPVARAATTENVASPTPAKPVVNAQEKNKANSVEGPPEQMFDLTADRGNFSVDTSTPASHQFYVNTGTLEGSFVAVEPPEAREHSGKQSLPQGFVPVPGSGDTDAGWPHRIRSEIDGKEMACVPSGLFTQGTDHGAADAAPAHPMSLDTYYIDVTEVTVGEFSKFKATFAGKDGGPAHTIPLTGNPKLPVVKLSWKDAHNYAKWAGKDLPTEAEWEKAGRGPDAHDFPWGSDRILWHQPRQPGQIDPVGTYSHDRSRYGVLDLAGNAREWCSDWYSNTAYHDAKGKDGSPAHNWPGPRKASNGERVVKGGVDRWELWTRGSHSMIKPAADIGFRCVLRCGAEAAKE